MSTATTAAAPAAQESAAARSMRRRVLFSSYLGSTIEFYDFHVYGVMATLIFGSLFFSSLPPAVATIASLATLATGYLIRPIGGVVFGHFGDKVGRKSMLIVTMAIMGVASFLIGVLPTYAQIGVAAPILLLLMRIVQGIAVGGEWAGAALMAMEHSPTAKRGFGASFSNMGAPSGAVLSAVVVAIITQFPDQFLMTWGWRIPFLLSAVLLALGLYVRHSVSESPDFERAQHARPTQPAAAGHRSGFPIVEIFHTNKKAVLLATFSAFGIFVLQGLMSNTSLLLAVDGGLTRSHALWLFAAASVLQVIAIPLYAALSDRVGRRPVLIGGFTASIVLAWPILSLLDSGNATLVFLGYVIAMPLVQASMYGPIAAFISEMFGTTTRYTGASLGYQLASSLGYGFAPLIASSLMAGLPQFGVTSVAAYIAVACAVSILAVRATRSLNSPTGPTAPPVTARPTDQH